MKVRWLESGNWEVVKGVDPTGEPLITRILVKAGEEVEVASVDKNPMYLTATIAYKDGTVLHGIPRYSFVVVS
jgi:hypothetical protein